MSSQIIEHVVLFKVKDGADPSDVSAMVDRISSLVSLEQVLHLSTGPVLRIRSSSLSFTHLLHIRYKSKHDLDAYTTHPSHVAVVKENAGLHDDAMALDWVVQDLQGDLVVPPGSAVRFSFLKLKENSADEVRNEVLGVVAGIRDKFGEISQFTCGENFSPGRAKGFSIGWLAVFPGITEMEAVDFNEFVKDKIGDHLESVMMLSVRTRPFSSPFSLTFSPSKHLPRFTPSPSLKPYSQSSPSSRSSIKMSAQTIEHIVLFKVKDDTDPSKVNAMVSGLGSLVSLDQVLHLSVGPLLCNRSSAFNFTHMLHSRYNSKDDLNAYSAHPSHVSVVKGSVLPICDDIMAVDWIAHNLQGDLVMPQGSAVRVSFLKLKENLGDDVKNEVLGVIGGIKDNFRQITQFSYGENFSPARAKGFSLASLAVFPGPSELEAVGSNETLVNDQKDKVREHLESVVVVDYVVPSPQARPASL
ncbi:stress-response A/B barrel domain-containing protein UP3-like [Senna tora]|uniref:Stress-response A/B barrel domain-containing protein UP3-like n=1 Tax=Senna tora TaxID=362788 RepID=A0A834X403_9FABA|nr:stress-response A/B barrel domain-containing protein UP3-like [Senna tora]